MQYVCASKEALENVIFPERHINPRLCLDINECPVKNVIMTTPSSPLGIRSFIYALTLWIGVTQCCHTQAIEVAAGEGMLSFTMGPRDNVIQIGRALAAVPKGDIDLFDKAGEAVATGKTDGPVIFKGPPPTGLTISLGPLKATGAEGATATSEGKVVGAPIVNNGELVGVKKTMSGSEEAKSSLKEGATAKAKVVDPVLFERREPGSGTFGFDVSLDSFGLSATGDGITTLMAEASTDLNGLGELFLLSMSYSHNKLTVDFVSNPALGLSDADIIASLVGGVTLDSSSGGVTLPFAFTLLSLELPVSETTDSFSVSESLEIVSVVNAPDTGSSLGLLGIGIAGIVIGGWRTVRRNNTKLPYVKD